MARRIEKRQPRFLSYVLKAISDLGDKDGSSINSIVGRVQEKMRNMNHEVSKKSILPFVQRALRYGLRDEILAYKRGKFRMGEEKMRMLPIESTQLCSLCKLGHRDYHMRRHNYGQRYGRRTRRRTRSPRRRRRNRPQRRRRRSRYRRRTPSPDSADKDDKDERSVSFKGSKSSLKPKPDEDQKGDKSTKDSKSERPSRARSPSRRRKEKDLTPSPSTQVTNVNLMRSNQSLDLAGNKAGKKRSDQSFSKRSESSSYSLSGYSDDDPK